MAIIFGAANAYLGLRVGMTVSASIPAAVISMGVIHLALRKKQMQRPSPKNAHSSFVEQRSKMPETGFRKIRVHKVTHKIQFLHAWVNTLPLTSQTQDVN